ncbi:class I SAM-dependent methyltransferase [Coleofasciculus sp. FACHB-T130]|uniref:class I SAM-dependent methyltransferase n=1 Tax=Cyanophyceae TaxID=3028117 RepID=UPI001686BA04|nr:class I SAM-dependent methyltransferase [Coleofasciculus sp. FACHB-T130]MBD1878319.1 class I SAM-dependent methyltransferase [Coleofasciculus sp. FACHB-T130]
MNSKFNSIKEDVKYYYTEKLAIYGSVPQGVDWNSLESQQIRFEQLLKLCNQPAHFSINDYGCGYGSLFAFMAEKSYKFNYRGFDLSEAMIAKARELYHDKPNCYFSSDNNFSLVSDYTIASGIFNVKLDRSNQEWEEYIIETLNSINIISQSGFAFNILTSYSDREYMQDHLYYADPCFYFDLCKKRFSRNVALLHDYGLYEFTLIVRKNKI